MIWWLLECIPWGNQTCILALGNFSSSDNKLRYSVCVVGHSSQDPGNLLLVKMDRCHLDFVCMGVDLACARFGFIHSSH